MARARGFTLLEMLVVMLIAGMALALTTQALGQYQRAHARALASERSGRELRLAEAWFSDAVRGLYPAGTNAESRQQMAFGKAAATIPFKGEANRFSGTTLAPVFAGQGVPVDQTWQLVAGPDGMPRLRMDEETKTVDLPLPRAARAEFQYLDAGGKWHAQWPPALGQWPQLPEAIVLSLAPLPGDAASGGTIVAAVMGPRTPYRNPFESEDL